MDIGTTALYNDTYKGSTELYNGSIESHDGSTEVFNDVIATCVAPALVEHSDGRIEGIRDFLKQF